MTERVRRLGRGLDALLVPSSRPATAEASAPAPTSAAPGFRTIPVAAIATNPLQPRKEFDPTDLDELKNSIRTSGLLQPLLVRPRGTGFELVAGERRFRAIQALGWKDVPVHVRELDDQAVLTLALIENLQRADLNPIEEAEGYQELVSKFGLTQLQVADAVGRERSTVANMLRLLALPDAVRRMVRDGTVSLGHARALLGLNDAPRMIALASRVVADGLTVRDVERQVREEAPAKAKPRRKAAGATAATAAPPVVAGYADQLRRHFQTDVQVTMSGPARGEVRLSFYSADDFERLLDLLLGSTREVL